MTPKKTAGRPILFPEMNDSSDSAEGDIFDNIDIHMNNRA